ncbi:MAG TPA: Hpt domain-containing protein, partial [Rhodocyclaceae bacterium]
MSEPLDIGPLSWVKGEIDLALTRAAERLYDPAEHKEARASLHQAQGALAVVGVSGLAEFTAAIEAALDPARGWSEATAEAVAEAIAALRQYLDDLLAGSPHQPLRLLRALTELAEACGKPPPHPAELFFPDLNQRPPRREVEPPSLAPEALAARLKAARMGFARGLAKWRDDDLRGLADMRNAIAIVEQTRATPGQRAFWWIALAFLDALAAGGLEADPSELCERIEAQMAALAAGDDSLPEALLRELLYQVAVADAQSEQIEIVRGAYRLRDLVPAEVGGRRADERSPRMAAVAGLLADAEAEWGQFCTGVAAALPRFHELATLIAARAESLGPLDFARLAAAIGHIADLLRRDPLIHNDVLADEIATALLLAERAARDMAHPGGQPGADFAQQVDRATSRLNALLRGEALETLAAPSLEANAGLELELELAESVCREILVNLAEVEQALDAFFRDPAQAGGLARLALPLKQVEGALLIFNEPRAADLVRRCAHRIAYFADPSAQLSMAEFELLARDLSALGFFIEQRRHGHADLDLLLEAEGAPVTEAMAPLPATAAPTPAATTAEAAPPGRNADLVDIFIEEASDVLAELDQRLPALAAEPGNADILRVVRRGFHTLKGSSRMVSLNEFGEAAWAVEQLLNRFLADRLHVGVRLLDLLADARGFFGEWVAALAAGDFTPRPTAGLIAFCNALLTTDTQPPAPASQSLPRMEITSLPLDRRESPGDTGGGQEGDGVGNSKHPDLSPGQCPHPHPTPPLEGEGACLPPIATPTDRVDLALLPTFLEEAAELIPRISESFRRWRLAPDDLGIAVALKRPLHTLKGSARMTGLLVLGERLHQLESQVEQSQDVAPMEAEFDAIAGEIEAMQPIQVAAPLPAISITPPPAAAETAPLAATIAIEAAAEPGAETPAETALLRVRADRVDQLVAEAGEIAITRSRAEAEVKRLKATMGELAENVARLRSQLREIEIQAETGIAAGHQHGFGNYDQFDPLEMDRFTRFHELTRLMAESVDDVATVQQTLQRGLDDAEDALIAQSRLNRDLSVGLLRVRMVPFDSVAERLHRTVRQAAA